MADEPAHPPLETPLEAEKRIFADDAVATGRISETVRNIAFGLLATFFGIVSSDSAFSARAVAAIPGALQAVAFCAIGALAFDYLQYYFGSRAARRAMLREDKQYLPNWPEYRLRGFSYRAKQGLAFAGCVLLGALLIAVTWTPAPAHQAPPKPAGAAPETS